MNYDVLYNFISPVTGSIVTNLVKWTNPINDYYVGFKAGQTLRNTIWTLPVQDGTNGQVLSTNGSGILSFIDVTGAFAPNDATYILQQPDDKLPNAQALNALANGYMINTNGVISTTSTLPLPDLLYKNIWIGDSSNRPQPNQTITIDNLPNLGGTIATGKIWRGNGFQRPEESNALTEAIADITALNGRFLTGNFIMGDALLHVSYPQAQFLVDLDDGILKKTGKVLQHAVEGTDYVGIDSNRESVGRFFATIEDTANPKWVKFSKMYVDYEGTVQGVKKLLAGVLATDSGVDGRITTEGEMFAGTEIGTRTLKFYPPGDITFHTKTFNLKSADVINDTITYIMPTVAGNTGDFLVDDGTTALGDRKFAFKPIIPIDLKEGLVAIGKDTQDKLVFKNATLTKDKFWLGNEQNVPTESTTFPITTLPDLEKDNVWIGDDNNRPVPYNIKPGSLKAKFILQQPDANFDNAQALSSLATGILKSTMVTGVISIASGGGNLINDYVTPFALIEQINETRAFATSEAAAAEAAANVYADGVGTAATAAAVAISNTKLDFEMVPYLPIPLYTYGLQISNDIGNRTDAVRNFFTDQMLPYLFNSQVTYGKQIKNDIKTVETRIDNLNVSLVGDISGSNNINNQITTSFTPNPTFTGNQFIRIPTGNTSQRPVTPKLGMLRLNTDALPYPPVNPVIVEGTIDEINVVNTNNTFKVSLSDNPILKGKSFIKIPTGNSAQRPSNPSVGMLRCNTDL